MHVVLATISTPPVAFGGLASIVATTGARKRALLVLERVLFPVEQQIIKPSHPGA
jgi:hypothetical protein